MRLRWAWPLLASAVLAGGMACGSGSPTGPGTGGTAPLAFDTFQAASLVIGQPDLGSGERDAGSATGPNAAGLGFPYGTVGASPIYIPDFINARVLGYGAPPSGNGANADFVLGQVDFDSSEEGNSRVSFRGPLDCRVAGGKLFLLDYLNSRVLIWNTLPTSNQPADVVVGQMEFGPPADTVDQATLGRAQGMFVADGKLFVSDTANHRILIWNQIPTANGTPADVVIGQPNFTDNASGLSATKLRCPTGIWSGGGKLVVADSDNARVLVWNSIPVANGAAADLAIGATDLATRGGSSPTATSVGFPVGVCSDGRSIFVADSGNHRVLMFPFPEASGVAATHVLGQTSFTLGAYNDPDQDGTSENVVSARTFGEVSPYGIALVGRQLVVSDTGNHRVLFFRSRD